MDKPVVDIFTYTTIKGPRKRDGACGYVLQTITPDGPRTLEDFVLLHDMAGQRAELTATLSALERINRSCIIILHTASEYVRSGFEGLLDKWVECGWKTSRGGDVANREEWLRILSIRNANDISVVVEPDHEYASWLEHETEKFYRKEIRNGISPDHN